MLFIGFAVAWLLRMLCLRFETHAKSLTRVSNVVVAFILVFTWVMGCGITTRCIGTALEKDWEMDGKPHGDISGLPNADAIVVLGGGMGVHKKCGSPEMFGSADRVWQGAKLYKAGKAPIVVMSGPDVMNSTAPLLRDLGVPEDALVAFPDARNTEEEAKGIWGMLKRGEGVEELGAKASDSSTHPLTHSPTFKILLVTSAWHMNRAKLLFERVGFDVIPAPTDFEMNYVLEQPSRVDDFLPSADAFIRNSYAVKEWVGNVGYCVFRN